MREHLQPLTDDSPMPFGEHKGTALRDVPSGYLLWLLRQEWIKSWRGLYDYLIDRQDVLLSEVDDSERDDDDESKPFSTYQDFLDYS